jgi:hypothetical protein
VLDLDKMCYQFLSHRGLANVSADPCNGLRLIITLNGTVEAGLSREAQILCNKTGRNAGVRTA